MRSGWIWLMPALLASASGAQTGTGMTHEGKYWVVTSSGTAGVEGCDRLQVTTRGAVTVEGESRKDIQYTLKGRTRVQDAAKARTLLGMIQVKTAWRGETMTLEVTLPPTWAVSADLKLRVPRDLRQTFLASQGEMIEALDLDGALGADSGGGRLHVDRIGGDVTLKTDGGQIRLGSVGGNVVCFSGGGPIIADTIGGKAGLDTEGGEIIVKVAKGLVRASTGGGNIRIDRAERGVTATARAGLIDIIHAGGPVIARTGTGAIKIRSASDVQCQAGTGAIQLQAVYGGVRAATLSGSILAEFGPKPLRDSVLSTGAGDITVYLPSNVAVTVEATSADPGGSRIVSDFAEIRPRPGRYNARYEAQGAINGGGPLLRLAASGGRVYLRRQK
jgi:hypothetical protein